MYHRRRSEFGGPSSHVLANYARRVVMLVRGSSLAAGMRNYLVEANSSDTEHSRGAKQPGNRKHLERNGWKPFLFTARRAGKHRKSQRFLFSFLLGRLHTMAARRSRTSERGFILTGPT